MSKPIITRLEPMAAESFLGFLARAAAENEMGSLRNILIALGLPTGGLSQILSEARENLDVADALQVSKAWLLKVTAVPMTGPRPQEILFHDRLLPLHQVIRSGRRYSPGALQSSAHNRYYWDVEGVAFHFETFELLEDTCQACKRPLILSGSVPLNLCDHCHSDLTQTAPRVIRSEDRDCLQLVADLYSNDEVRQQRLKMRLHPQFRHLNPGIIYQLVLAFGRASHRSAHLRDRSYGYPYSLIAGAKIIAGFPHSLEDMFRQTSELVVPEFYQRIRRITVRGVTAEASEAIEIALQRFDNHLESGLKARSLKMAAMNLMGVKKAASELGLPVSKARKLVDQQVLKGAPIHAGVRKYDAIRREDVLALNNLLCDKIALKNITGKYGMPQTAVEQLVDIDLIRQHPLPLISEIYVGAHAKRSEVEDLMQSLSAAIPVDPDPDSELIPLTKAFALYGPHPRPWSGLFTAVLEGRIRGGLRRCREKRSLTMANLFVDASLFKRIWNNDVPWSIPPEPERTGCTCLEIEERLSIFPRDTSTLMLNGHLADLPDARLVDRSQVVRIARRFISTVEIAAHLGIPPSAVKSWAKSNRIKRRDDLPMWRREDVRPLLPETAIEKLPIEPETEDDPIDHPARRFHAIKDKFQVNDDVYIYNLSKGRPQLDLGNGERPTIVGRSRPTYVRRLA